MIVGVEPGSLACKASTLPPGLSLSEPPITGANNTHVSVVYYFPIRAWEAAKTSVVNRRASSELSAVRNEQLLGFSGACVGICYANLSAALFYTAKGCALSYFFLTKESGHLELREGVAGCISPY